MLANAKINLHLHITGRAENGYHLLDSLVAFTSLSDEISIKPSDSFKLNIAGSTSLSSVCSEQDNLISRATHLLAQHLGIAPHVAIRLLKNIPLAGGLGGGSADAAATLLLLKDIWQIKSNDVLEKIAASLGSDIVACLYNTPVIMRDTGNKILNAPKMPHLHGLLVNPNVQSPTPEVYKTYAQSKRQFSDNIIFPEQFHSAMELCAFLKVHTHNDLTDAAISIAPEIGIVLNALDQIPNKLLARLSGSGATCFALFENAGDAQSGYELIQKAYPDFWAKIITINQA
jgi:4-diphosphocytidyl-2-C-methyl-D-erythritol kinase